MKSIAYRQEGRSVTTLSVVLIRRNPLVEILILPHRLPVPRMDDPCPVCGNLGDLPSATQQDDPDRLQQNRCIAAEGFVLRIVEVVLQFLTGIANGCSV